MSRWYFIALMLFCFAMQLSGVEIEYFPPGDADLQAYLDRMPWQFYKKYAVPGLGRFWVDDGKDCVKDEIRNGRIWEPYIVEQIKKYAKPGDNVIDIGAHMGSITLAMSNRVGKKGTVHSFECVRQFFREIIETAKLNSKTNIKPYLAWICDKDEVRKVYWYFGKDYSSVRSKEDKPYLLNYARLDSFGLKNISLIKIDVESSEDQVLDGAYQTIMTSRPVIIIEIRGGTGNNITPEVQKLIDHTKSKLETMAYTVSKIYIDDYLAIPIEKLKK